MDYEAKTWYNEGKDSDGNVVANAPKLDADNLNRLESGIKNLESGIKNVHDRVDKIYSENLVRACDYSRLIKNTTYSNKEQGWSTTWTVTEDCWVAFSLTYGSIGDSPLWSILIDGTTVVTINSIYGYGVGISTISYPPCLFVKQGSVLKIKNECGMSSPIVIKAFGCLE